MVNDLLVTVLTDLSVSGAPRQCTKEDLAMTEETTPLNPILILGVVAAVAAKEYWTLISFLP